MQKKLTGQAVLDLVKTVKFDTAGLVPAIAQDRKSGEILMLAYMNSESLRLTLKTGIVHYYSRSRKKLWKKGESSGNVQKLHKIAIDCDGDALLLTIEQIGDAACHTGYRSCFFRTPGSQGLIARGKKVFNPDKVYGIGRKKIE